MNFLNRQNAIKIAYCVGYVLNLATSIHSVNAAEMTFYIENSEGESYKNRAELVRWRPAITVHILSSLLSSSLSAAAAAKAVMKSFHLYARSCRQLICGLAEATQPLDCGHKHRHLPPPMCDILLPGHMRPLKITIADTPCPIALILTLNRYPHTDSLLNNPTLTRNTNLNP